ncbi:MFS transporter [Candidatus Woesearchaeota archaeon]|nr:MFS transporter [Candidatus Woesearchaeota archaeon]
MNRELEPKVKEALQKGQSIDNIKTALVSQGFLEDEVAEAIQSIKGPEQNKEEKTNNLLLSVKEVLDRIGYGFSSVQFINILFYLTGAGFFLIGIINGLKTILSLIISSFLQEYAKARSISKKFMSNAGILFGISFLVIAAAIVIKSLLLFSIALLVGSIGVVTYGDLYNKLVEQTLKKEKMGKFLLKISHYGVLITGVCLVFSGYLFDKFPIFNAQKIWLFGKSTPLYGYLIAFEITAIAFILSGYVLHYIKDKKIESQKIQGFIGEYWRRIRNESKDFLRNKYLATLLIASAITGLVQILGNSYYGIYIYKQLNFVGLGGFLNVAVIFAIAIVISFLGPAFSKYLNKKVGLAPSLVFGTALLAIMPLVAIYNPHFMNITVANAFSVLGAAILGMSQGLLIRKLLNEEQRKLYFAAMSIVVIIPLIILVPIGAWMAQAYGLLSLFKILAITLLAIAAPVYFILVLMANKLRL